MTGNNMANGKGGLVGVSVGLSTQEAPLKMQLQTNRQGSGATATTAHTIKKAGADALP